jgi:hypothetical protein
MMELTFEAILAQVVSSPLSADIREHLPTLTRYASLCESVTEFGVRGVVSTWALMAGKPARLTSFDLEHYTRHGVTEGILEAVARAHGVDFRFIQEDVLTTGEVEDSDLLFIDTLHAYRQMKMELMLHAEKARKFLIFHDIVSFGNRNEAGMVVQDGWPARVKDYFLNLEDRQGINPAIVEFLRDNRDWVIEELLTYNNGLLVLRREG